MKATGKFILTDIYDSQKTGKKYLTLADLDNGGEVQLSADQVPAGWELRKQFEAELEVSARRGQKGGNYLTLLANKPVK